jgi:hypothetical protein
VKIHTYFIYLRYVFQLTFCFHPDGSSKRCCPGHHVETFTARVVLSRDGRQRAAQPQEEQGLLHLQRPERLGFLRRRQGPVCSKSVRDTKEEENYQTSLHSLAIK